MVIKCLTILKISKMTDKNMSNILLGKYNGKTYSKKHKFEARRTVKNKPI